MPEHKFKIGQQLFPVHSTAKKLPGGVYVVIKRLPKRDSEFEYQIKTSMGLTTASCARVSCEQNHRDIVLGTILFISWDSG
jgi:hypothetical protein